MSGSAAPQVSEQATYTAEDLARIVGGELRGPASTPIRGINALEQAADDEITFIATTRFARRWATCAAGAAVVSKSLEEHIHDDSQRAVIVVDDAEIACIALLELFARPVPRPDEGVHATAWIDPSARLGAAVRIGPAASVDREAVIGDGVVLYAGARIYPEATIGAGSVIHANAVVRERCVLGSRVVLHAGAVIGSDGFGFRPAPGGGGLRRVPHLGTVHLDDDVEIGANACVDRGKFGATVIQTGTKIDNLVQIGHNCHVGRHCVVAGLSGLSGSVRVGDGVRIGGNVGIADHVQIGSGASLAGRSGVMRDVEPGQSVFGYPADDSRAALRQVAALRKLPGLLRRLSAEAKSR